MVKKEHRKKKTSGRDIVFTRQQNLRINFERDIWDKVKRIYVLSSAKVRSYLAFQIYC